MSILEAERPTLLEDPLPVAVKLRPPVTEGARERFSPSDLPKGADIARFPRVAAILKSRKFQFFLILPNQIIFWTVIFWGLLGVADPNLNFGSAITWFWWFCLVFVMMAVVGRAWCVMCPFGGFAEWIQRRTFWTRTQKALGLGLKFPKSLAKVGFVIPVVAFLGLTWVEEFFNIAGPGWPGATSWMVVGIVGSALLFFMVFERRTFCRYICPLTTLIGTAGSMGSVAGFRTRDREVCLSCKTKDCMRGGTNGFGCPWYTWPGSSDSNLYCGLCSECYKACPQDNIGLFLQKPLTSVVQPKRRRFDVAWGVAFLYGLVLYQQFNATTNYGNWEGALNARMHFPHYPNPVMYTGILTIGAVGIAVFAWIVSLLFATDRRSLRKPGGFWDRGSAFRAYFNPIAYALIPIMGMDYFARQLPKFFLYAPNVIPSFLRLFGDHTQNWTLMSTSIIEDPNKIVIAQVIVVAIGALAAIWATWRISGRELAPISRSGIGVRLVTVAFTIGCAVITSALYVAMHAAT